MSLIIVQHFYDLAELALAKRKLEEAGIKTVSRDELTMQVTTIEARAIGGAKLLVNKQDYVRASQLLIEAGFMDANNNPKDFWIVDFLDGIAKQFPLVRQFPKELRVVFLSFFIIAIPFMLVLLLYI
ncbi:putative signal transducing protein [Aureispira anguillae]|uniref:DUF2007 domain-containing protein n=1 Tax=Aureispira anguillae TaxID=2864201 RepID=A0A915YLE6_9BACT|nr:DUF2007 domain-containing protein [Aureispira anguillae]BDS15091.1 DUF2007 domain-containing protein [Aureispira anguillae]